MGSNTNAICVLLCLYAVDIVFQCTYIGMYPPNINCRSNLTLLSIAQAQTYQLVDNPYPFNQ